MEKELIWITSMRSENLFTCSVCGYDGLNEAPYDEHGCSSFTICPSCGTEFGYDDCSMTHEVLRKKWVLSGMKWWSTAISKPKDYDPVVQLRNIE